MIAIIQPLTDFDQTTVPVVDTDELDDPYKTCAYGHHMYRLTGYDADGNPYYRCEDCGDEDPEGSQAR